MSNQKKYQKPANAVFAKPDENQIYYGDLETNQPTEVVEFILQAHEGNNKWREVATTNNFEELMCVIVRWKPNQFGISTRGIGGWAWVKQNDLRIIKVVTTTHVCYMPPVLGQAGVD